jgi:L-lactate dehydrogenase complex protein LldG
MNGPSQSRQLILNRIRAVTSHLANEPAVKVPRDYTRRGSLDRTACVELMVKRLREYDAEVVESAPEDLIPCIADRLKRSGKRKFTAAPGVPVEWAATGRGPGIGMRKAALDPASSFEWKVDRKLSYGEIEECEGVLSAATAGIADSGTIVLHHSPSEGRRIITLLPDWHLCVLKTSQIVETLPEYFDRIEKPPALATYISGPSATADIEMTRVKGVHGPRFLNVIIVHDEAQN